MWHGPQTVPGNPPVALPSPGSPAGRPGAERGPVVVPGSKSSPRIASAGVDHPSSRATPWHGPYTASNSVVGRPTIDLPDQPPPPKATMFGGPHTSEPSPESPDPPMRTFPMISVLETTKATMFNGPHTAEPPKQPGARPNPPSPPKGSPKATMFGGPHTANPTRAQSPTPMSNSNCKAPYQLGVPSSISSGTCIQYRDIYTATSKVNCAGCPPPQPTPDPSSSTALVGFGGLFGPGPMVVSKKFHPNMYRTLTLVSSLLVVWQWRLSLPIPLLKYSVNERGDTFSEKVKVNFSSPGGRE
jgi:hypothetical protein